MSHTIYKTDVELTESALDCIINAAERSLFNNKYEKWCDLPPNSKILWSIIHIGLQAVLSNENQEKSDQEKFRIFHILSSAPAPDFAENMLLGDKDFFPKCIMKTLSEKK